MRKYFLLLVALTTSLALTANPGNGGVIVPLTPVVTLPQNGTSPRSPILIPEIHLNSYTLTVGNGTLGSTIQLSDEDDNVVFSTFVFIEGDIELPTTLSGTYTIQVLRGSQTFEGEITL